MPRTATWHLQKLCKHPARLRGSCRSSANTPHGYVALAEALQTPRTATWLLQKLCKRLARLRGTCRSSANAHASCTESEQSAFLF